MSLRTCYLAGSSICLVLMALALYMQYVLDMEPCPLCVFQRIVVVCLGVLCFVAWLHDPTKVAKKVYGFLSIIISLIGMGFSGRHVWIQNLPEDKVPTCGPGLEFMMETMPLQNVIEKVLKGSGECHDINWVFLGLTIPGWTFCLFFLFFIFGVYQIVSKPHG